MPAFLAELAESWRAGWHRIYFGPFRLFLPLAVLAALYATGTVGSGAVAAVLAAVVACQNFLYRLLIPVGQPGQPQTRAASPPPSPRGLPRDGGAVDAVVIGAGAAGLAAAACVRRRGLSVLALEAGDEIGAQWRSRYSRLHLHTEKESSGLPYVPFPDHVPMYPSRRDVADYLAAYRVQMRVPVAFGERAESVGPAGGDGGDGARWEVRTASGRTVRAGSVVVAIGDSAVPIAPVFDGEREHFGGRAVHSSELRSCEELRGKRVLVVGFGNSGAEIALGACEHGAAAVESVVRSAQSIVTRDLLQPVNMLNNATVAQALWTFLLPLPAQDANFKVLRLADPERGVRKSDAKFSDLLAANRPPLLDIGTLDLIRRGDIVVRPAIQRFEAGGRVRFDDGTVAGPFDVVIKATGFSNGLADLVGPDVARQHLDPATGRPLAFGREAVPGSGLYFNGYKDHMGKLREMAIEGMRVGAAVAADARARGRA